MLVGPLLAGFIAVSAAVQLVPRPGGIPLTIAWIVLLVGVSSAGAHAVRRITMDLAPLAALFRLSLVFPDEAPSRFKTALRARTGRHLAERADGPVGAEQGAAEEMVALLARLSRHDRMTRGHSERVRAYSVMLGEEIGLDSEDLDRLNWAALIHDIGKLEVPAEILNKAGRPTAAEWDSLRGHPQAAAEYVEPLRPWLGEWVDAATQHHERWDGGGYPAGLAAEQISRAGRIVAISDAFDVMTAARSYKSPLPAAQARAELLRCAGNQFDPILVRAFLRVSLGRMRWVVGPMAWLTRFPDFISTPATAAANGGQAFVAASVVAVAASTGLVAPAPDGETAARPAVAERVVETVEEEPLVAASFSPSPAQPSPAEPGTTTVAPSTTSSTSTTTTVVPTTTAAVIATTTTAATGTSTTTIPATTTTIPATTTTIPATTTTTTTTVPDGTAAVDDDYTITKSGSTTLQVTSNDAFGSSGVDPSSLVVTDDPSQGQVEVAGGNLKYIPNEGATGTDRIVYRICAFDGSCDDAAVTITLDLA
jgi:HD domain-containing protein/Big-like domain-containing protein